MITEDQYWNAQPQAVRALRNLSTTDGSRIAQAATLANEGFTIDGAIMVNGWDANIIMTIRQADGMTWVPSFLQPNIQPYLVGNQTATNPPFVPYDPTNRPPGSIKVSTNPNDYPPFDPPPPPPPAPATNVVGFLLGGNVYASGPGAMKDSRTPTVTDGQKVEQSGVEYTAHVGFGLMGPSIYFTKD